MGLGQQLKKFRESQNLSQEDVAKKIGVTRQAVYKKRSIECFSMLLFLCKLLILNKKPGF